MDLPLLLGTMFTADRSRASVLGYAVHFVNGLVFSLGYAAIFYAVGRAGWISASRSAPRMHCSPAGGS